MAKRSLRNAPTNLRQLLAPYLCITRYSVSLNQEMPHSVDYAHWAAKLATVQWDGDPTQHPSSQDLIALKSVADLFDEGEFLAGFYVTDAPLFEKWMLTEREYLRREREDTLEKLARGHALRGEFQSAIIFAHRWLALDPLREVAHRTLMALYAWSGDRSVALRQYQTCVQILEEELGVEPSIMTQEMHQRLLAGDVLLIYWC